MNCLRVALLVVSLFSSLVVHARVLESLDVDAVAWTANYVVVATEGDQIDGELTVLQSWKGDLTPGARIQVPELALLRPLSSRLIRDFAGNAANNPPEYVGGNRMILFLRKNEAADGSHPVRTLHCADRNGFRQSVAWSEKGRLFAYWQFSIPGTGYLQDYQMTEDEMRARVAALRQLQESWWSALALADCRERVQRLSGFLVQSELDLSDDVLAAMERCGNEASPGLHQILDSPSMTDLHSRAIEALVRVDGARFAPDLIARLDRDVRFWKTKGPGLEMGWWNRVSAPETNELRDRYMETLSIIRALTQLKAAAAREEIVDFRNFWRSLQQLDDASGLNQMSEQCDVFLAEVH